MKAEPPRKPAKAKAKLRELSERDSNLDTGGGRSVVDWYRFTGRVRKKPSHVLPGPDISQNLKF